MNTWRQPAYFLTLMAIGCGHAAGTRPADMSAAEHEAVAKRESHLAAEQESQFDPNAAEEVRHCDAPIGGDVSDTAHPVCWNEFVNPTEEHRDRAQRHRALAARHRAASEALTQAEANSCHGISERDRDMSPFAHADDIRSVAALKEGDRVVGATITLRAVAGLTAERLQKLIACHLARNAAVGNEMPEMPYCPLVPKGATAEVRTVDGGFAVDVRAEDPDSAAEIWRRAQALKHSGRRNTDSAAAGQVLDLRHEAHPSHTRVRTARHIRAQGAHKRPGYE